MKNISSLLYAEDDDNVRESYLLYFSRFFENVYGAKDGEEAWDIYQEKLPNVIILDINMPKLSGLEVANKIREVDESCKIIMLTAYSDLEKLLTAVKLNLTEYLIKPPKRLELERTIMKTIDSLSVQKSNIIKLKYGYSWDVNLNKLFKRNKEFKLTKKETMLFNLLSSNLNINFSNEVIMNYLYNTSSPSNITDKRRYMTLISLFPNTSLTV